ncbi:HNH endonuclease [Pendulispora brunnea]|uniref:HNH endonuclease n=1 Tax=Pendulispora brunnea TaxID=2905690 RepID=A0ABZ2KKK8_9BACT
MDNAVPYTTTAKRVKKQTFEYDYLSNHIRTTDDANLLYDRSLGKVQMDAAHPNQISQAGPRVDGSGTDYLEAAYDAGGNLGALVLQRDAARCGSSAGCTQRFAYDWDEVGRLARARRWDYSGPYSPSAPPYPAVPNEQPDADLTFLYDANNARVVKQIREYTGPLIETEYSIEIFDSLRLDHAHWDVWNDEYERTDETEKIYLALGGARLARIVYDPNLPTITRASLHVFLEIGDELGSTSTVIDKETGELVEQSTYVAYGAPETDYRPARWRRFREEYRFTGKEDDVQVGLTYFGERYYSAPLARWISPDPLTIHALGAALNPYSYLEGRVYRHVDPLGLDGGAPGADCTRVSCLADGNAYWRDLEGSYVKFDMVDRITAAHPKATSVYSAVGNSAPIPFATTQERYEAAQAGMKASLVQIAEDVVNFFILAIAMQEHGVDPVTAQTVELPKPADPGKNYDDLKSYQLHENYEFAKALPPTVVAASPFALEGIPEAAGPAARRLPVPDSLGSFIPHATEDAWAVDEVIWDGVGVDFSKSRELYPVQPGQTNIVEIEYTGSYAEDFAAANKKGGFDKQPKDYVWHHLHDYDETTNRGTMQLVHKDTHNANKPHTGGVNQYEKATGNKYRRR